jgi:hypothetical protein
MLILVHRDRAAVADAAVVSGLRRVETAPHAGGVHVFQTCAIPVCCATHGPWSQGFYVVSTMVSDKADNFSGAYSASTAAVTFEIA